MKNAYDILWKVSQSFYAPAPLLVSVDRFGEFVGGQGAHQGVDNFAILEEDERWKRRDVVLRCRVFVFVDVDLKKNHVAELFRYSLKRSTRMVQVQA